MALYEVKQDDGANRERKKIAKAVRSAVRLHYSMMADDYINQVLWLGYVVGVYPVGV